MPRFGPGPRQKKRRLWPLVVVCILFAGLCGCGGSSGPPPQTQNPPTWVQITASGAPPARWAHVAVLDAKRHRVVVFGGAGTGNPSEVWFFSLDTHTWQTVTPSTGPSSVISGRAVIDPQNDRMVIVGGTSSGNTVWALNLASNTWSQLPSGPSSRFDLDATTDGKRAWFFGGFLPGFVATNELWQFDFSSNTWSLLPSGTSGPSPRTNAALGFFSNFLYLTGGHDQHGLTPGTWRYDLNAHSWQQLTPTGSPGAGAHFGYDVDAACGDLILAFGDHDDGHDVSSTDLLSLTSTPQFTRLAAQTVPPPRRHAPLVFDPQTRTLFTFGGLQGTANNILSDTWIYQLGGCSQ